MAYVSQLDNIIKRIMVDVVSVSGIVSAQVHNGRRRLDDKATWMALGWDATYDRPSGWYVARTNTDVDPDEGTTAHSQPTTHTIQIVGWLGVRDYQTGTSAVTGPVWTKRVEDVCTAVREDQRTSYPFNGTAVGGAGQVPHVVTDEHQEINGVTCHYIEIELTAVERVIWS